MKTTTTTALKNKFKYSPMSEGNTCIAEPNLEVLPLIWFSKGLVQFQFFKIMYVVMTLKVSLLHYQMTTNSAVNRNLACVINN